MLEKLEVLVGTHAVAEALRAGRRRLVALYLDRQLGGRGDDFRELAEKAGVTCVEASTEQLDDRAAGARHQGVLLEATPLPQVGLDELLDLPGPGLLVAADGIEDPQNFGALLRVCESAGVNGVIATHRRSAPLSPTVARASAGAVEHLPVARVTNLSRGLGDCRAAGYWLVAAAEDATRSLFDPVIQRLWGDSVVLVLGSEGRGIRPGILKLVDESLRIPMSGRVSSLNVSTAGAVILFDILRARLVGKTHGR